MTLFSDDHHHSHPTFFLLLSSLKSSLSFLLLLSSSFLTQIISFFSLTSFPKPSIVTTLLLFSPRSFFFHSLFVHNENEILGHSTNMSHILCHQRWIARSGDRFNSHPLNQSLSLPSCSFTLNSSLPIFSSSILPFLLLFFYFSLLFFTLLPLVIFPSPLSFLGRGEK